MCVTIQICYNIMKQNTTIQWLSAQEYNYGTMKVESYENPNIHNIKISTHARPRPRARPCTHARTQHARAQRGKRKKKRKSTHNSVCQNQLMNEPWNWRRWRNLTWGKEVMIRWRKFMSDEVPNPVTLLILFLVLWQEKRFFSLSFSSSAYWVSSCVDSPLSTCHGFACTACTKLVANIK